MCVTCCGLTLFHKGRSPRLVQARRRPGEWKACIALAGATVQGTQVLAVVAAGVLGADEPSHFWGLVGLAGVAHGAWREPEVLAEVVAQGFTWVLGS